ncbi:MAG: hypothetical protein J6C33_12065 [Lachnospiraceae bacterium]|nr:hypothetical protein [Lachnospiraceae bacterium]
MEHEKGAAGSGISPDVIRRNMLWNVTGSVGFIGAQWMMTILIVHLAGYTEAGYLSLGLSLTNIFTNIAYFCIRNYQVSDASGKYSADIYVTHRAFATAAAFVSYAVFVLLNGYAAYVTAFLLLFMLYRLNEPVVDVFHGIDQRAWRLDTAGKSFLLRGILTLAAFIIAEKITGNLVLTTLLMIAAAYGVIFLFDIPRAYRCAPFSIRLEKDALISLTKECFPLFVYAICLNAVVPIPRYFLEKLAGSEALGYYSSVAIPASVIQLLASYVFTTFTALFSEYLAKNEKKKFLSLFRRLTAAVVTLVLLALGGCALLGEWALVLLFTENIRAYAYLLIPTVACCGVIALIWFLGTVLTILRDMKGLLLGAVAGTAAATAVSYPCIVRWGAGGVNIALFVSSIATFAIFAGRFAGIMKRWK